MEIERAIEVLKSEKIENAYIDRDLPDYEKNRQKELVEALIIAISVLEEKIK